MPTSNGTLQAMRRATGASQRRLTTVMFTDIVGSTGMAADLGDRRWRQLVARHHAVVRQALKKHKGRELDTAGDGFFASFDQPGAAIACALELTNTLRPMGIEIRAGINMGEVEVMGPKVGGIAVHIGSRVMSLAGPGEVWVTSTVRDLMAGSDVRFEDQGVHELKGVPAQVRLYSAQPSTEPESVVEEPSSEREPPGGERRILIRRRAIAIGGVAALVAIAIVLSLLIGGSGNRATLQPSSFPSTLGLATADRVARISDATSGAALARIVSIRAGRDPGAIAAGEGSIWVANRGDGTVSRVDPVTNRSRTVKVGATPYAIAVGEGAVWVLNRGSRSVSRINPGNNEVVASIELGGAGFPTSIAVGEGSIWVGTTPGFDPNASPGAVHRIDTRTNREMASIEDPSINAYVVLAAGNGAVWAADATGRLMLVEPGTNHLTVVTNLRVGVGAMAAADGFLWIAATRGGILKIDPQTGRALATAPGGGTPAAFQAGFDLEELLGLTFGEGILWVTGKLTGTVDRIVTNGTSPLEPIRVGQIPTGIAVGFGSVWVSVDAAS